MNCAFMDAKLYAFDFLPFLAVEMHVEIADIQFGEFPFQRGWFDSQVAESAHGHVTADSCRGTVEKKNAHKEGG
jgi:hypothetical protein